MKLKITPQIFDLVDEWIVEVHEKVKRYDMELDHFFKGWALGKGLTLEEALHPRLWELIMERVHRDDSRTQTDSKKVTR